MPTIRFSNCPARPALATLPAALLALSLVGGCAGPAARDGDVPFERSEGHADGSVDYTVRNGDRLGDIALELTGDMSRWKEIAASNGIEDPRSLRAGAVLRIPAELLPGHAERLAARAADARSPAEPGRVEVPRSRPAVAGGLAVRGAAPVRLSPVDVNRRFDLAPLGRGTPSPGPAAEPAPATKPDANATMLVGDVPPRRLVKVVGSYFPKGIYAQPAAYSKLLMRVAPGTLFELDGEVGDWYGVVTSDGVGYLRDGDGRLVEEPGERTASIGDTRG